METEKEDKNNDHFVEVRVVTTSGSYPSTGFDKVNVNQKVRQQLEKAAKELKIKDTTNWDAEVNGRVIDQDKSYAENGLTGQVTIDFHRHEGGGGRE